MKITLQDVEAALRLGEFDGPAAQQMMVPQARVNLRPPEQAGQPRQGSVLLLLYQVEDELYIALTRRRDDLQAHPGQISFPGGRHEPPENLQTTALRETYEEIGIPAETIHILGQLSPLYILPSDFQVQPFVGYYTPEQRPRFLPDPREVAEIIELPLRHLLDPTNRLEEEWELRGFPVSVPFFQFNQYKVWGATAMMLSDFLERLRRVKAVPRIVQLHDLSKSFIEGGRERHVLNQVNYCFRQGEFVVLLGHSGSGKSTLLNLISGIDRPSSGDVSIQDTVITQLSERDRTLFRRDHIGFVFQFFNLIPTLTVLENVTLPQELAGRPRHAVEAVALHLLERVGLADRRDTFPDRLSGGEQQRVAIARALVHDPMLLLADEPTGNLDDETGRLVLDLLLDLTRAAGKTLLMATHNPDITSFADRVLELHDGQLLERQMNKEQ